MDKTPLIQFISAHLATSPAVMERIIEPFEARQISKNDFFLQEGKWSNEYLYLEKGFMRAYTHNAQGEEVTTFFFPENRVVFEPASFFMRKISSENIQALSDCKGYVISFEKLNFLFHAIPEFREFGRAMLVKSFVEFKQRTLDAINLSAEAHYAKLLQERPQVFQYAPLKQIASYLGITDTSLSRIRREFSKK